LTSFHSEKFFFASPLRLLPPLQLLATIFDKLGSAGPEQKKLARKKFREKEEERGEKDGGRHSPGMDGVARVGWGRAGGFEDEAAIAGAGDLKALEGGVDEVEGFAGEEAGPEMEKEEIRKWKKKKKMIEKGTSGTWSACRLCARGRQKEERKEERGVSEW